MEARLLHFGWAKTGTVIPDTFGILAIAPSLEALGFLRMTYTGLRVYLVYEFACALAAFVADLPNEQIDAMSHNKKLRGCVFDQTSGRRELLLGLVAAHLCARCEGRLSEMGVSDKAQ